MKQFLREHYPLLIFIFIWVIVAAYAGLLLYAVLPISVFLMRRSDMWQDIMLGFLICLIFSDMNIDIREMAVMKTAKYTYILAMALIIILDQARMRPVAKVFGVFLPFFIYAFFPVLNSSVPVVAVEKTISYALIFLVVPNYVLFNYRRHGWDFFRNLIWFIVLVLLTQHLLPYLGPVKWAYIADRFRGYFGNPNGLAIFTYLAFVLFTVINHLRKDLFSTPAKFFIYALLIYYVITCGARTSLMSTLMFVLFIQFFRISTFLGIISFVAFVGIGELVSSNLPAIITAMGLQDYLRVDSLADGSGRYFAWNFAWQELNTQGFFLFGGGFDNEAWVMKEARAYLESLGHQGGVHNTYLAFWLNTGIVGLILFLRSFVLIFIKASKNTPISMAIMFSVLFSILYESWLAGSLSPYTTMLLIILTIVSEDEIMISADQGDQPVPLQEEVDPAMEPLVLPAR
ncbi:MAG: O-antigen ligase family protein [Flavobacteriales bacterium]|jgi:O-antigen ligase|nr:O-antigen ligase family protein [Flavobacteriales bacterium]MBK7248343.1 O-antigen ligase family protein [Flavobacteriales bacterium]MBK7286954.1 O-antigen ligase family protein [Flavobacteriales bacterium]MBK9598173.1 O-antigen ligase family protein [Flavobacteriales bacterium]QQS73597.1 MAG: O-antigen ligase family protein [Flavobacteriales bacterium]